MTFLHSPKNLFHISIALLIGIFVLFFLSFSISANASLESDKERFKLPLPALNADLENASNQNDSNTEQWQEHSVKIGKNDTLGTALHRLKIPASTTHEITLAKNSRKLTSLRVGDELKIWVDKNHTLQKILYPKTQVVSYELVKTDSGYHIHQKKADVEIRTETAIGTIEGAFYPAAKRAGLSARSIMNLADIFSWDIDFGRQLRPGDNFKVIYETKYLNGQYIGDGSILAAQLITNKGKDKHNAFLMRDKDKTVGYYNEKGKNLRKAFLRSPVDYVRITSRFNPKRFHPVLKKWRSHRGVDYGGPKGTPIRATGNGKIIRRGWSSGYGKHIRIQHANKYTTVYGHFSRYGKFKKGQYVKQGDVIGYMGKTGLATGVHLHYEFRVKNRHVDPLKVKFPDAAPINRKYRTQFKKNAKFLLTQLDRLESSTQIARKFE